MTEIKSSNSLVKTGPTQTMKVYRSNTTAMVSGTTPLDFGILAETSIGGVTRLYIGDSSNIAQEISASAISVTTALTKTGNVISANVDGVSVGVNGSNELEVKDAGISTAKLADASVSTAKIIDASVTTAKIAANAVTAAQIANNTITAAQIAAGTITTTEVADGAITTAKLADASVSTAKVADGAITTAKIADGTILGTDLSATIVLPSGATATTATSGNSSTLVATTEFVTDAIADAALTAGCGIDITSGVITSKVDGVSIICASGELSVDLIDGGTF